jgi:hypothetical protein
MRKSCLNRQRQLFFLESPNWSNKVIIFFQGGIIMSKKNSPHTEAGSNNDQTHPDRGPWANGWHPSWGDNRHQMGTETATETESVEFTPDQSTTHQSPDN